MLKLQLLILISNLFGKHHTTGTSSAPSVESVCSNVDGSDGVCPSSPSVETDETPRPFRRRGCNFTVVDMDEFMKLSGQDMLDTYTRTFKVAPVLIRRALKKPTAWAKRAALLKRFGRIRIRIPDEARRGCLGPTQAGPEMTLGEWHQIVVDQGGNSSIPDFLFTSHPKLLSYITSDDNLFDVPDIIKEAIFSTFMVVSARKYSTLPYHNHERSWSALVQGRKLWLVAPPDADVEDIRQIGEAEATTAQGCVQQAGEVVWLPTGWFHQTFAETSWTAGFGGQGVEAIDELSFAARLGRIGDLASVSRQDIQEQNLLVKAINSANINVLRHLLTIGADTEMIDGTGHRALHRACTSMSEDIVRLILEFGANANALTVAGQEKHKFFGPGLEPIHICAAFGLSGAVEALLEVGAKVNADGGMPPLSCIRNGIDREQLSGATPLHYAAQSGHAGTVKVLLRAGADRRLQDGFGKTAVSYAEDFSQAEVIEVFSNFDASGAP